jgi:hypothetical protein
VLRHPGSKWLASFTSHVALRTQSFVTVQSPGVERAHPATLQTLQACRFSRSLPVFTGFVRVRFSVRSDAYPGSHMSGIWACNTRPVTSFLAFGASTAVARRIRVGIKRAHQPLLFLAQILAMRASQFQLRLLSILLVIEKSQCTPEIDIL